MASWADIAAAEPDFARRVQARFDLYKHKVIATLRRDGSPRISGIEAEFTDGQIVLGMMPRSLKAHDLLRDPRLALHSGTEDPSNEAGAVVDAKLAGRGVEQPGHDHHVFHVDVTEVALISVADPADHLVIETWHKDKGLQATRRY